MILALLLLAWKWRLRDLVKRGLILVAIPVLHLYFLRRAENPLAFQAWTLAVLCGLLALGVYRAVRWFRSLRS
jgi:hypothetical protein